MSKLNLRKDSLMVAPSFFTLGLGKINNIVVLIPAILFIYFGSSIIFQSYLDFFFAAENTVHHKSSYIAVLSYIISMLVEIRIVSMNIVDAKSIQKHENKLSGIKETKQTLFASMKAVLKKKDPVLQAVLFENMITLMSTSIPLVIACYSI